MEDQEIKNEVVHTMLTDGIVGGHKAQRQTVVGYAAIPTHAEGRAKDLIDDLIQEGVIEAYGGGHRSNIRLRSVERAVEYLKANDGDVPWGYD
jgi:hypothetical protein